MRLPRFALALPLFCLCRPAAADESAYAKQIDAKAASVVNVKFVAKIQGGGRQGGGQDREVNGAVTGIVVDASGVVMIPSDLVGGGSARRFMSNLKVTTSNFRVLFEGDVKEYDAILGAIESKLGLQFVRIKDVGERKLVPLDLSASVEPYLGHELFGVSRLQQGFDFAPFYGVSHLIGQVTKPRTMWLVNGFFAVAHPLYDNLGRVAGILIRQSGVAEGDEQGPGGEQSFLLPAKAAAQTIAQAIKASAAALEKEKARAKEAEEAAPAMGEVPAVGDAPAKPGMEEGK